MHRASNGPGFTRLLFPTNLSNPTPLTLPVRELIENKKVINLIKMQVLMFDEVSMLDTLCWQKIVEILTIAEHSRPRNRNRPSQDELGNIHIP